MIICSFSEPYNNRITIFESKLNKNLPLNLNKEN